MHALLDELRALEVELHHPGVRCNPARLEALLHPGFHEVGRSGARYDRATLLRYLGSLQQPAQVESGNFAVHALADNCALLTYTSAHREADGTLLHRALRSSVWLKATAGWQLFYHQGTPAPAEP
ncbi:MAG: nuclear transport factor 2 family protein [Rubrivivax sp.]|nr:nuclear transport factor 2 family protein [Rubrivivax sp.]